MNVFIFKKFSSSNSNFMKLRCIMLHFFKTKISCYASSSFKVVLENSVMVSVDGNAISTIRNSIFILEFK